DDTSKISLEERKIIEQTLKINKLTGILQQDEFVPIEADEGIVYQNEAFAIGQLSNFDIEKPYGTTGSDGNFIPVNEIGVTIFDKTSKVKNVVEYLFMFDIFANKLATLGFELLYERELS